jgi:tryptophan synthase alpha subunit
LSFSIQFTSPRICLVTSDTRLHVMQVSAVGVTGARSNVNTRVEHLLQEIKQVRDITCFE